MSATEFYRLLNENSDNLRAFALFFTQNQEEAKDLLQETLFRALNNKEKYSVGTHIKSWLYCIMRNIFINDYRRQCLKRKYFKHLFHTFSNHPAPDSSNSQTQNLRIKEILAAVHSLPPIIRIPMCLIIEGYNYQEIADTMCIAVGTVKSRIHFGRKKLNEKISVPAVLSSGK
jgi:RNA polymerase sigma factor (sigma-70 family)